MVQNAIVKQLVGEGMAQVSLLRQMECGLHCDGACAGCSQKPPQEILALAANPIGAKPGDFVEVEPSVGHGIGLSVIVFLLPCVGLGAGYALGQALLELGDVAALGTGALGLALGFLPALWLNRSMTRSQKPEFSILRQLR
ncbi:SoxR reducing system RseC family protein [Oscillospiraceae bacterium 50-16]|jgi:sigma-E factor negative regulatory protein RseC|nr:SoxR reducing system RseC family protein [Lawsonibacter sp.]